MNDADVKMVTEKNGVSWICKLNFGALSNVSEKGTLLSKQGLS